MRDRSASWQGFIRGALAIVLSAAAAGCSSAEGPRASAPAGPTPGPGVDSTQWLTYENAAFGFSLEYPEAFVVLREPAGAPEPPLVERVRFLDRFLAESETRDLHPPKFHVEIYARPAGVSLRQWLEASGQVPASAAVEAFTIAGAVEALRVADRRLIAPNEFYYAATDRYVYKLTPIGEAGPRMLSSFRLSPPR